MRRSINTTYIPYILSILCLITRLIFFGRYIDDWDGVNFAFALSRGYDVLQDQPHFQGYPVYIFVSWLIYNIWHSDIHALILAGIIFSSLAIIPLYHLASRMFSWQVAALASVLYIVNPQVWLQAEKTLSDAFGLFFVITFTYLFYRALEQIKEGCNQQPREGLNFLFLGSLILGLGIGVRISYLAFIAVWGFVVFLISARVSLKKGILYGFSGLGIGIMSWLGWLVSRFGIAGYFNKFMRHSNYFFTEDGFSILGSTDYIERLITISKNILAHSLGVWWIDTPLLRLLPTLVMIIAIVSYIISGRMDLKNRFILISIGVYVAWLIIIQKAIRHTIVLIPFIIILISAGVFYFVRIIGSMSKHRSANPKQTGWQLSVMLFFLIVPMAFDSTRLVWINREIKPPQVALIDYIVDNYDRETTKFFCLNTWRLFQYYAPEWHDKGNRHLYFTSRISDVVQNLRNRYPRPKNVLISSALYEREKYKDRLRRVKVFERDSYAVAEYNRLALYEFDVQSSVVKGVE